MASPVPPGLLVSDGERDVVLGRLNEAFAEGRLTADEMDQRLTAALTARTHADLAPVLAGLPEPDLPRPPSDQPVAALAHVLGAVTFFAGPLAMFLMLRRNHGSFARAQAAEALNFQISLLIVTFVTAGMGFFLWPLGPLFCIAAAIRASKGRAYEYPLTIRLVR